MYRILFIPRTSTSPIVIGEPMPARATASGSARARHTLLYCISCCHVPTAPSASLDGGISHKPAGPARGERHSRDLPLDVRNVCAGSGLRARSVLLLLLLTGCCAAAAAAGLLVSCWCCCWRTLTPPGVRWCQPGQNNKAPQEIRPAHFALHARSAQHDSEDRPENQTPKYCPNRRNSRPAWEKAPHTLPRTHLLALGRGCLRRSRR
jgi:hypothetical protein